MSHTPGGGNGGDGKTPELEGSADDFDLELASVGSSQRAPAAVAAPPVADDDDFNELIGGAPALTLARPAPPEEAAPLLPPGPPLVLTRRSAAPSALSGPRGLAPQIHAHVERAFAGLARGDRAGALEAGRDALDIIRATPRGLDRLLVEDVTTVFAALLGGLERRPTPAVARPKAAATLDHKMGFLLSQIDGLLSIEELLDVSGMPRLEAVALLVGLLAEGFIEVR